MDSLADVVSNQYRLSLDGIHGLSHWRRVETIGLFLSHYTNADIVVVEYFAYLHDSQRFDEGEDPDHGKRAADFAEKLYAQKELSVTPQQLETLQFACFYHNNHKRIDSGDVTIETCWDSDRLDLWRLSIAPDPGRLYSTRAKEKGVIEYARYLNTHRV